jgi:hypothetical protein
VLLDEYGHDIPYRLDAEVQPTRVFAGPRPIVHDLIGRRWEGISRSGYGDAAPPPELYPMRAQPGRLIHSPGVLGRAHGCLLGLIAGDWQDGRPGPHAEGALLFARTLLSGDSSAQLPQSSDAVATLMRAAVLGVWGTFRSQAEVVAAASERADPALANAIAAAIRDGLEPPAADRPAPIDSALMGAVRGREAFPQTLRNQILSCRPMGPDGSPPIYWPTDALVLAERLLTSTPLPGSVSYALTA